MPATLHHMHNKLTIVIELVKYSPFEVRGKVGGTSAQAVNSHYTYGLYTYAHSQTQCTITHSHMHRFTHTHTYTHMYIPTHTHTDVCTADICRVKWRSLA